MLRFLLQSARGFGICAALAFHSALGQDWPQVQGNAAHTGYTAGGPKPPYVLTWSRDIGEPLYPGQHVIAAGDFVYVATGLGNVCALARETGETIWKYKTGGPVLGSVALADGMLFVASSDCRLHAVKAGSGERVWMFETGEAIWSSPVVAGGKVFVGGRDGFVYAIDTASGKQTWRQPIGGHVMATPAVDDGVLYVPAGDMRVYAYATGDGNLLWTSPKLAGAALRDTWLAVGNGVVLATTQYAQPNLDHKQVQETVIDPWVEDHKDDTVLVEDDVFPRIREYLTEHRTERVHWALDAKTGEEKFVVPILPVFAGGCVPHTPAISPDGWAYTVYMNVQIGASGTAFFGRMNLTNGDFEPLLTDFYTGPARFRGRPGHQPKEGEWARPDRLSDFYGSFAVVDHAWAVSLGGSLAYIVRDVTQDRCTRNYFDLATRRHRFLIPPGQKQRSGQRILGNNVMLNHSLAVPISVSGKMLFHKSLVGAVDAYEGK